MALASALSALASALVSAGVAAGALAWAMATEANREAIRAARSLLIVISLVSCVDHRPTIDRVHVLVTRGAGGFVDRVWTSTYASFSCRASEIRGSVW